MIEPLIPEAWIKQLSEGKFDVTTDAIHTFFRTEDLYEAIRTVRLVNNFRNAVYEMQLFVQLMKINEANDVR